MNTREVLVSLAEASLMVPLPDNGALPEEIQWMPPGTHDIVPFVDGEPKPVRMQVTAQLAELFNRQLQTLRGKAAAGEGDFPYLDLNHKDDEASAEVLALYWAGEDPKAGGIRARVKWSGAGEAALRGRNYRRFSPTWALDPETHQPLGVKVNLGGLVNRAAFRNIAHVVAKNAGASTNNPPDTMTDEQMTKVIADALKPLGDRLTKLESTATAAAAATTGNPATAEATTKLITEAIAKANQPLLEKITNLENAGRTATEAQARAAVEEHGIKAGRILAQDKDSIAFWEGTIKADAKAVEQLKKMHVNPAFMKVVQANGTTTTTGDAGEHEFVAKARDYATANKIENALEAQAKFAGTRDGKTLYDDYRQSLAAGN